MKQFNFNDMHLQQRYLYNNNQAKQLSMEAVGSEVLAVILPLIILVATLIYQFRTNILNIYYRIFGNPNQRPDPILQHPVYGGGECAVCLDSPKNFEVSATCGHSFCGECLLSIHQRQRQKIACPLCRRQITTIFKTFPNGQGSAQQRRQMQERIHYYNQRFDDNRPWIRRIAQFPYVMRRLLPIIMNPAFIVLFFRSIYFFRSIFFIIAYILMPLDLIPERFFGVAGLIDDVFFGFVFLLFGATMFALVYMRGRRHD